MKCLPDSPTDRSGRARTHQPDCKPLLIRVEHKKNKWTGRTRNGPSGLITEPPLLIIAAMADDLDLAQLPWCAPAVEKISVNQDKFKDLEMVEIIIDAMPFILSRLTAGETRRQMTTMRSEQQFPDIPSGEQSAIGVAPGEIVASARHLPEVNRRLLLLGKWIGQSLDATAAVWKPSRTWIGFANFSEAVARCLTGSPVPPPFQTSFSEVRSSQFTTSGLKYFAGQEIRLTAPAHYSRAEVIDRLERLIEDIATCGRIDRPARAKGLVEGESLFYSPTENLGHVDILIQNDRVDTGPAKT
jgi:hypothetical protein